jgi:hypothetical protein
MSWVKSQRSTTDEHSVLPPRDSFSRFRICPWPPKYPAITWKNTLLRFDFPLAEGRLAGGLTFSNGH